jgi:hypothetical protein
LLPYVQISVIAGGVEEGKFKGKLHLQVAVEWWDDEGLAQPTISKHIRASLQPLLDGLLDTDEGETWPLKIKAVPKVKGVRAKGGWFYQLAYTQKDRMYDYCRTFHTGVDIDGATKLGTYCVNEIWAEALTLFEQHADANAKGASGKRMWATLAAQVAGRSHCAIELLEKSDTPSKLLKFTVNHGLTWLQLDPVTVIGLMLSTGAYMLGTSWIASAHGGKLDVLRFGCMLRIMSNGRLAKCRPLLNQALFGQYPDDENVHVHTLGRSSLLPSMFTLQSMTLDELKALNTNGLEVPQRLRHKEQGATGSGPTAVIIDLSPGCIPQLVDRELSSYAAAEFLSHEGAHVNPLIIPAFAHGGDATGAYAAALVDIIARAAGTLGLMSLHESDAYSIVTEATEKVAEVLCSGQGFKTQAERINFLVKKHMESTPCPGGLDVNLVCSCDFKAFKEQYKEEAVKKTANQLFVHIIKLKYYTHDSDGAHVAARADDLAAMEPLRSTWQRVLDDQAEEETNEAKEKTKKPVLEDDEAPDEPYEIYKYKRPIPKAEVTAQEEIVKGWRANAAKAEERGDTKWASSFRESLLKSERKLESLMAAVHVHGNAEDDDDDDVEDDFSPTKSPVARRTIRLDDDEFDDEETKDDEEEPFEAPQGAAGRGSSSAADAQRGEQSVDTIHVWPSIPTFEPDPKLTDTHMYVIAYFPGHKQFVPTRGFDSLGTLEDETGALWAAITACTSIAETRELLMTRAPADFYRYGDHILRNKALALASLRAVSRVPRRELAEFTARPLPLSRGCVLLSGASGIGKTCFAEAHGQHPFVIRTLDQCKDIPLECDLLVFDDMRFDAAGLDLRAEEMLSLLTADRETSVKCRHFDGMIPAIPRIFTTNLDPEGGPKAFPAGANSEQQKALDRRVFKTPYLRKRLYNDAQSMAMGDGEKLIHRMNPEEVKWSADPSNVTLW